MLWRELVAGWLPGPVRGAVRRVAAPLLQRLEQPRLGRLYAELVAPGELAFDVGAAEGSHASVLAALGARVLAVEPNPATAAVARRRLAGGDRVTLIEAAVAGAPGRRRLAVSSADPELTTLNPDHQQRVLPRAPRWDRAIDIEVVTVDDLIAAHGVPRFLKIDVEGSELEVLQGLSSPVPVISFELQRRARDTAAACVARLAELGPYRFNASIERRFRLLWPDWLEQAELLARLQHLPGRWHSGDVYALLDRA